MKNFDKDKLITILIEAGIFGLAGTLATDLINASRGVETQTNVWTLIARYFVFGLIWFFFLDFLKERKQKK